MAVTGIGGFFFRARDPAALSEWYRTHLGIGGVPELWHQAAGPTVFEPFAKDTDFSRLKNPGCSTCASTISME